MFYFKRNGIYYFEYQYNGSKKRISTKSQTLEEAKKFVEHNLLNFVVEPIKQLVKESSMTVSLFEDEYIEFVSNSYSAKYLKSVKLSFKKFKETIEDKPIKSISARDVEYFITKTFITAQHASHLYHRTLKAAFSKAVVWEYLDKNPFKVVKPPKVVKKSPAFITSEELRNICDCERDQQFSNIYYFAFYSGMRIGEITNLRWNCIDFKKQTINVINSEIFKTKSKVDRSIPMHPQIKTILKNTSKMENSNFVFNNTNGIKLNEEHVSKRFKKALRLSNVSERIRLHDLRHSFASSLVQKGVPLYVIKELLGHSDISTTQIYAHLQNEQLFDAVFKIE